MVDRKKTPNTSEKQQTAGVEKTYLNGSWSIVIQLLSTQPKILRHTGLATQ